MNIIQNKNQSTCFWLNILIEININSCFFCSRAVIQANNWISIWHLKSILNTGTRLICMIIRKQFDLMCQLSCKCNNFHTRQEYNCNTSKSELTQQWSMGWRQMWTSVEFFKTAKLKRIYWKKNLIIEQLPVNWSWSLKFGLQALSGL